MPPLYCSSCRPKDKLALGAQDMQAEGEDFPEIFSDEEDVQPIDFSLFKYDAIDVTLRVTHTSGMKGRWSGRG
jgi:hypothetical protein